jgi:hypothetical protein
VARLYLKKTMTGFAPADEESRLLGRKFKRDQVYRAEIVKPRSYQHHKLCFAMLNLTFDNQDRYANFENFRKAVAMAAGHCDEFHTLDGEVIKTPKSISFDTLDEVEFTQVMAAMMTVCCGILGVTAPELEAEVSKYSDENYGKTA